MGRFGTWIGSPEAKFSDLLGITLEGVDVSDDGQEVWFKVDDTIRFWMGHHQDCCEEVCVEEVVGDLHDLLGSPILLAEETSSEEVEEGQQRVDSDNKWTFYKLATIKGYVTLRWLGTSNGYYSVDVDFAKVVK